MAAINERVSVVANLGLFPQLLYSYLCLHARLHIETTRLYTTTTTYNDQDMLCSLNDPFDSFTPTMLCGDLPDAETHSVQDENSLSITRYMFQ